SFIYSLSVNSWVFALLPLGSNLKSIGYSRYHVLFFTVKAMRLDKFLCESTELSRVNAKKYLHRSEVTCDGIVVKNPAFKVPEGCDVRLQGESVVVRGLRYIMLNKPMDMLCSNVDEVYPSVISLLDIPKAYSLHIAGRLDADTTGLVLITDDGQWSHRLTSPIKNCGKRYRVWLTNAIENHKQAELVEWFAQGVRLKGEKSPTKPAVLEVVSQNEMLLTITEGKYHQVKRMFAAAGNKVVRLHREQIGEIELDSALAAGKWRELTLEEIAFV
ncbi:MAG: pseudouridine synthase, partial [Endozoicomonas sp.]